tara:strand:+ start:1886 stop:2677 length:792 start_codon:yes stop_codon:yes gene_type:complete
MDLKLNGKTAIICASSKGIGYSVACGLAKEGVNVIINSRNEDECNSSASYIKSISTVKVLSVPGDLSKSITAPKIVEKALNHFGRIDILFNNCGGPPMKSFLETNDDQWEDAYNSVLMSTIRMTRLVAPQMISQKWGRIITLGSSLMKEPTPQMVLSCTCRAAVLAFMKAISYDLAPHGVTANTISTGGVSTERLKKLVKLSSEKQGISFEEALSASTNTIPMKRFASPDEFSQLIIFLASELSSYITGECLSIDGGLIKSAF